MSDERTCDRCGRAECATFRPVRNERGQIVTEGECDGILIDWHKRALAASDADVDRLIGEGE